MPNTTLSKMQAYCREALIVLNFKITLMQEMGQMKMPDNPNTWMQLFNAVSGFFSHIPAAIIGALMAAVVAVLRVVYEQEEKKPMRICLEGTLCGLLTLSAGSVIQWLNMPESLAVATGGFIGFVGVVKLRDWANNYLDSFGRNKKDDNKK